MFETIIENNTARGSDTPQIFRKQLSVGNQYRNDETDRLELGASDRTEKLSWKKPADTKLADLIKECDDVLDQVSRHKEVST